MIESVEVLQDGASAIYGADAIAGVVNLHTRSNFEGLTTEAKYGISSHGDGTEYTAIVNWGAKSDSHSFFVSGTYVKDKPVMTGDRELTGTSLSAGLDNLAAAPSSPRGLYVLPGFSTSKSPLTQNIGLTEPTGLSSYHTAALPGDYYNADAQGLDDVEPSERYGLYAKFTQELPAGMHFNADLLYNHRGSSQLYSPTNLYIGGTTGTYKGYAIAANQAYNPFGVGFAANQPWGIQIFTPQVGDRAQFEEVNTYRTSMSLAGDLSLLAHPWTWTLFGSAAENHMQFTEPGGNRSRAPCAGAVQLAGVRRPAWLRAGRYLRADDSRAGGIHRRYRARDEHDSSLRCDVRCHRWTGQPARWSVERGIPGSRRVS